MAIEKYSKADLDRLHTGRMNEAHSQHCPAWLVTDLGWELRIDDEYEIPWLCSRYRFKDTLYEITTTL